MGRGGGGPSIGVSAAVTSTARIVLLISLSRLHISVRVYPMICS